MEDNDGVTGVTTDIALRGDLDDDEIGANAEHCLLLAMLATMAMTMSVSMILWMMMTCDT